VLGFLSWHVVLWGWFLFQGLEESLRLPRTSLCICCLPPARPIEFTSPTSAIGLTVKSHRSDRWGTGSRLLVPTTSITSVPTWSWPTWVVESEMWIGSRVRLVGASISFENTFYRLPFTTPFSGSPNRSFSHAFSHASSALFLKKVLCLSIRKEEGGGYIFISQNGYPPSQNIYTVWLFQIIFDHSSFSKILGKCKNNYDRLKIYIMIKHVIVK
jgi:hypothetical protein